MTLSMLRDLNTCWIFWLLWCFHAIAIRLSQLLQMEGRVNSKVASYHKGIHVIKIRRSVDHLIFIVGIPTAGKPRWWPLYWNRTLIVLMAPWYCGRCQPLNYLYHSNSKSWLWTMDTQLVIITAITKPWWGWCRIGIKLMILLLLSVHFSISPVWLVIDLRQLNRDTAWATKVLQSAIKLSWNDRSKLFAVVKLTIVIWYQM